ncbi:MAG TPA: 4'-phosphopantetheinyl transferase superfamily protein [Ktedonobacteraceae bacterium]|nr:4'-phosphopantetheinyl transferase superfamily protein [Ktedonobacteraceae bacterium]
MNYHQQWSTPPLDLRLQPDEVHVWRAPLVVPESVLEQLNQLLSERETTRALSFRFAEDRRRWIVAHGVLRMLLGRYVRLDPRLLHFDLTIYGKPLLAFPIPSTPLQFNLSHSRDIALYAFAYSRQVGVDVEYKRAGLDYDALARVSFSPNEQAALRSLPDDVKREAFYTCWTRKEAYIKARGKGMSTPLDQFDVSCLAGEAAALLQSREDPREIRRWALRELAPGNDYAGALAVEGFDWSLSCWQWHVDANS